MKAKVKVIVIEKWEWLCTESEGEKDYALKGKGRVSVYGKVEEKWLYNESGRESDYKIKVKWLYTGGERGSDYKATVKVIIQWRWKWK